MQATRTSWMALLTLNGGAWHHDGIYSYDRISSYVCLTLKKSSKKQTMLRSCLYNLQHI